MFENSNDIDTKMIIETFISKIDVIFVVFVFDVNRENFIENIEFFNLFEYSIEKQLRRKRFLK